MAETQMKDKAMQALENAVRYAQEEQFEKALERHLWFHENALSVDAGYYAVRISYAIDYWMQLAGKYEPALQALKDLRNENAAALLQGEDSPRLFDEVRAIDVKLDQVSATVGLFKGISEKHKLLANKCFKHVVDAIVAEGEGELYMKHANDPRMHIAQEIVNFNRAMRHIADHAPRFDDSIKEFETHLADLAVAISGFAEESGDKEAAREIREETLKLISDDRLKV